MTRILAGIALAALVTSAAHAQQTGRGSPGSGSPAGQQQLGSEGARQLMGPYGPRGEVIYEGQVIGQDPDPTIRPQILREFPFLPGD